MNAESLSSNGDKADGASPTELSPKMQQKKDIHGRVWLLVWLAAAPKGDHRYKDGWMLMEERQGRRVVFEQGRDARRGGSRGRDAEAKRASFFHGVDATARQLACAAQRRSAPCRILGKLVALAVAHATSTASWLSLVVLTRARPASAVCSSAERR